MAQAFGNRITAELATGERVNVVGIEEQLPITNEYLLPPPYRVCIEDCRWVLGWRGWEREYFTRSIPRTEIARAWDSCGVPVKFCSEGVRFSTTG